MAAFAGADERVLTLEAGSQICGELIAYEQGAYTVRTASPGTIKLPGRQAERLVSVNGAISTAPMPSVGTALARKPTSIVDNASIEALMQNPQVHALTLDPGADQ
jgi:hypothetical protein